MMKVGVDPSGTVTTAIVAYRYNKIVHKKEFLNKDWIEHYQFIDEYREAFNNCYVNENGTPISQIWNIENCLFTSADSSKDRDDLLRLLGAIKIESIWFSGKFNWVSPRHTKSVVKNIESLSKYNNNCIWEYEKDNNLTYQYGKGWKYNNEKISNHLRDAIIIANYES